MTTSTRFSGSALYVQWIYSGGTIVLTGDRRVFNYSPASDLIDQSAGSDTARTRLNSLTDFTADMSSLMSNAGTALEDALKEGTHGTLWVGPAGTLSTRRKYVLPCISKGSSFSAPYADVVEFSVSFDGNGTVTYGTY